MSDSQVPPAPGDDSSAEALETDISAETAEQTGIQVDLYGIKAHVQPVETGEPTPKTWADVGQAVNAKLMSIAVNLPGLVDDLIVGGRKFMRGFAQIPAALARRIDRAHEEADRVEAVRQEKMEARALPPPAAEETVDRLESLLFHLQLDGAAVEIRELEDGRQAILIVKPEDRQIAAKLAAKALPAPAKGRKGRSKAKPPTGEANPPKPKTKSQTRPQKKDSNPGTPE